MFRISRCKRYILQLAAVLLVCIAVINLSTVVRRLRLAFKTADVHERCSSSELAAGPWRRWRRHPQASSQLADAHPPAGLHLASLLHDKRHQPPPPPPHPVEASYPVASVASGNVTLLILVKSAPENEAARRAIRETWGDPELWQPAGCLIRFILGSPVSQRLLAEAAVFGDIIVHGGGDGYRNNTQKLLAGFAWAVRFLASLRLLLLTDDDLLLNPFLARPLLKAAEVESSQHQPLMAGHLVEGARPVRLGGSGCNHSKWCVTIAEYPFELYPDYLSTGWLLLSGRLLPGLLWAAGFLTPRLPFDDVYLGLLAARLRLPLTSMSKLLDLHGNEAAGATNALLIKGLLGRHGYSGETGLNRMRSDWNKLARMHCEY